MWKKSPCGPSFSSRFRHKIWVWKRKRNCSELNAAETTWQNLICRSRWSHASHVSCNGCRVKVWTTAHFCLCLSTAGAADYRETIHHFSHCRFSRISLTLWVIFKEINRDRAKGGFVNNKWRSTFKNHIQKIRIKKVTGQYLFKIQIKIMIIKNLLDTKS